MAFPGNFLVGTSWSSIDWVGPFYPANLKPGQFSEAYRWANELKKIVHKGVKTYAFFNNHYAGFAPGSAQLFDDL
jgi:uncharacterized protein YecE (DUF72 family)